MNTRQTILQNEKLKNIHNYLIDVYKSTCSGYTSVSLNTLVNKHNLKFTYCDAAKAVVNLNLVKFIGAGRNIKYFWSHDEYPTMEMANRINVEMNRIKTNRDLNKSTEKMIEGRNLVPIIKNMSEAVETLLEAEFDEPVVTIVENNKKKPHYYIGVVKLLEYHKENPITSFAKTVKNFNVPSMLSHVMTLNNLVDENKLVKQDVDADGVITMLKQYWADVARKKQTNKQTPIAEKVIVEKSVAEIKPVIVNEPIVTKSIVETPIIENIDLTKITKTSTQPEYYDNLVIFLNFYKKHILNNKKLAAKTFKISPELIVVLKSEHYTEEGFIKPDVTPEMCIELMRNKFKNRKSRSKTRSKIVENEIKKQIIVKEQPKYYTNVVKNPRLISLIERYESNPNDRNLSFIMGYLYAEGHLNVDDKIELKEIEYIKKNIFGQRILKTRMQTMAEYILEIAKPLC